MKVGDKVEPGDHCSIDGLYLWDTHGRGDVPLPHPDGCHDVLRRVVAVKAFRQHAAGNRCIPGYVLQVTFSFWQWSWIRCAFQRR